MECIDEEICTKCNETEFYVMKDFPECRQCDESIREYFDNGTCSICPDAGFYFANNECKTCIENCVECENGQECISCNETVFYVLTGSLNCRQCNG